MSSSWPPSLRNFVENVLSQTNESNKVKVNLELKDMIQRAYVEGRLWTTNWMVQRIPSLHGTSIPPPSSSYANVTGQGMQTSQQTSTGKRKKNNQTNKKNLAKKNKGFAVDDNEDMRSKRAKRFESNPGLSSSAYPNPAGISVPLKTNKWINKGNINQPDPNVIDWDQYTIVGHSNALEKQYLRLTSAPDPATIRPLPVLKKTLDHLKKKWRQDRDYNYICDQMKSLRQDLTVQRIKNDFTVQVYEIHARLALENGDLGEFNQCAANLQPLYRLNLNGNELEFLSYQILYLCYSRNWSAANILVRSSLVTNNYHMFFKLYQDSPNMSGYIIDAFVERERLKALIMITKAYVKIPLSFITRELKLENETATKELLKQFGATGCYDKNAVGRTHNGVPPDNEKVVLCKEIHTTLLSQVKCSDYINFLLEYYQMFEILSLIFSLSLYE
ncbi:hypothetical protein E3Q18_04463 [Wallemia mellicola]|uniref:SAC3/GANP/THP3 conserved domain-containing protein n=1 Tax=Wallemia mellicola TaxID=1708541 RepID=A0A4V4N616_9BASI|nr:hypothetical protein E3Q23_04429 [Wallemia mellicola]TIB92534.1 hypothetical protein E3Q19_01941 [Wallemia mellicola]TIB93537.1 hypothetical protein E3Q18_04463 [Wallemia mellicola]TIB97236.1 hypothetical protein E3Q16_04432 [Wallemia mellicola]TIC06630.1 hypothetical protein E3Q14_04440 [Wallemia mellicola]